MGRRMRNIKPTWALKYTPRDRLPYTDAGRPTPFREPTDCFRSFRSPKSQRGARRYTLVPFPRSPNQATDDPKHPPQHPLIETCTRSDLRPKPHQYPTFQINLIAIRTQTYSHSPITPTKRVDGDYQTRVGVRHIGTVFPDEARSYSHAI